MIKKNLLNKLLTCCILILTIFSLTGCGSDDSSNSIKAKVDGDIQRVTSSVTSNGYEAISVQKGIPVEWTIKVDEGVLTSCNNAIVVEKYGIQKKLSVGENIIKFTPTKTETVPFTCWMGMIKSDIFVVDI